MDSTRSTMVVFAAAIVAVVSLMAGPARATTLVVDDNADPTTCGQGAGFSTISTAVAAATSGDTILVCPGTYTEQVTITTSGLTLQSVTPLTAIIQAPSPMAAPKAIVSVNGATGVSILDFTIAGPGGSGCDSIRWGVRIDGGGSAIVDGNRIQYIRDNPFSGCQNGIGILVGRASESTTGTATITDNEIVGYQKGGIVVDNTGSSATIEGNMVVGHGATSIIAQNGVQVSRGASAAVSGNTITGHFYTGCSNQDAAKTGCTPWVSAGLLLYDVLADAVMHSSNMFRSNQFNLLLLTSQSLAPGP